MEEDVQWARIDGVQKVYLFETAKSLICVYKYVSGISCGNCGGNDAQAQAGRRKRWAD